MEKLTPQEKVLIVNLYRSFKSNPKEFRISDEERLSLVHTLDLEAFDINLNSETITYYSFTIGAALTTEQISNEKLYGEESRALFEVIRCELDRRFVDMLVEIRKGNIPNGILVNAAYLNLGIRAKIIPSMNNLYNPDMLYSDIHSRAVLKSKELENANIKH